MAGSEEGSKGAINAPNDVAIEPLSPPPPLQRYNEGRKNQVALIKPWHLRRVITAVWEIMTGRGWRDWTLLEL